MQKKISQVHRYNRDLQAEVERASCDVGRLEQKLREVPTQTPSPSIQSMKQKIDHARSILVPKVRWKEGKTIEDVAYVEGILYALTWLSDHQNSAPIDSRQVRT